MANGRRPVNSRVAVPAPNQIEPQRARSSPNAPRMQRREQRRGGHGGGGQHERRREQPGQRRREDAVGEGVVAAVPLAVPDRKPLLAEQVGAEGVGRHVDGARLPDQVDDREGERDQDRRGLPPVDPVVPAPGRRGRRRMPPTGAGAASGGRVAGPPGGAATGSARRAARQGRLAEKPADSIDQFRPLVPAPVAGVDQLELDLAAERLRVAARRTPRRCRDPRVGQRTSAGQRSSPSRCARALEHLGRRGPVELQDRALGAMVEAASRSPRRSSPAAPA